MEETNINIQIRLGLDLPPCYMLIPTNSQELWETHIQEGNTVLIRCAPKDGVSPWETHLYKINCISPEEPQILVNIDENAENALADKLNNPVDMGTEFRNIETQYIWLPDYARSESWAVDIYRLVIIGVEHKGILVN